MVCITSRSPEEEGAAGAAGWASREQEPGHGSESPL